MGRELVSQTPRPWINSLTIWVSRELERRVLEAMFDLVRDVVQQAPEIFGDVKTL